MAEIDIKDTQAGTAGINLFGWQIPTWLLVVAVIALVGGVYYATRKPAVAAPLALPIAQPVMQAAGRLLKKLRG